MNGIDHVYMYRTQRDDGMQFCFGATFTDGRKVDGMIALFQTHYAAMIFADALRARGVEVLILPSAEVASPNV